MPNDLLEMVREACDEVWPGAKVHFVGGPPVWPCEKVDVCWQVPGALEVQMEVSGGAGMLKDLPPETHVRLLYQVAGEVRQRDIRKPRDYETLPALLTEAVKTLHRWAVPKEFYDPERIAAEAALSATLLHGETVPRLFEGPPIDITGGLDAADYVDALRGGENAVDRLLAVVDATPEEARRYYTTVFSDYWSIDFGPWHISVSQGFVYVHGPGIGCDGMEIRNGDGHRTCVDACAAVLKDVPE
jgi:hypothetical protein